MRNERKWGMEYIIYIMGVMGGDGNFGNYGNYGNFGDYGGLWEILGFFWRRMLEGFVLFIPNYCR